MYPVLYSEEFKGLEHSTTTTCVNNTVLYEKRKKLIQSALRYKAIHNTKVKVNEAPSEMTTFKPFNVRELEYSVWDTSRAKNDAFISQFESQGLLGGRTETQTPYQHPFQTKDPHFEENMPAAAPS